MNCKLCGKVLVPIGRARKHGKAHADWNTRKYHKKCWKKLIDLGWYDMIDN